MEGNLIELSREERCGCAGGGAEAGGGTLAVLRDVQRAYEERMEMLERAPNHKKLQMQVDLLRSWVSDLVGQNTLLARAVEELEAEATTRLFIEQRKHSETVCELRAELAAARRRLARKEADLRGLLEVLRRLRDLDYCDLDGIHFFEVTESDIFGSVDWEKRSTCGKVAEMKMLNESLHMENVAKDREIRKLHKDAQQYEQTIVQLRNEISLSKYHTPDVSKKDAEVMAGMCCTGAECGDWEPVKDFNSILREEMISYQERIKKMEHNVKCSGEDVRALRKVNVGLRAELHALRGVCAALGEQARAAALRGQFKDEIIREMRRQLKHAKAKTKEAAELISIKSRQTHTPYDSVTIACVRQPRRARDRDGASDAPARSLSGDGRSPRLVVSGEDLLSFDAD